MYWVAQSKSFSKVIPDWHEYQSGYGSLWNFVSLSIYPSKEQVLRISRWKSRFSRGDNKAKKKTGCRVWSVGFRLQAQRSGATQL